MCELAALAYNAKELQKDYGELMDLVIKKGLVECMDCMTGEEFEMLQKTVQFANDLMKYFVIEAEKMDRIEEKLDKIDRRLERLLESK